MTDDLGELAKRFDYWGRALAKSSPLYARLSPAVSREPDVLAITLEAQPQQRFPMLFFAGVKYLLGRMPDEPLRAHFPVFARAPAPDGDPTPEFIAFCRAHAGDIAEVIRHRSTQTNEVMRTGALLPAFAEAAAAHPGAPVSIVEIGCSAGLNLLFDRFAFTYGDRTTGDASSRVVIAPEVRGDFLAPRAVPPIASRLGIDLSPLDPRDDDDVAWLHACIWPEHTARERVLEDAVALARAEPPVRVMRADALDVLGNELAAIPDGHTVCVFHTMVLAYLAAGGPERVREILRDAGREVFWIAGEGASTMGSLLGMELPNRTDGSVTTIARVNGEISDARALLFSGFHGEWVEPLAPLTGPA